jgi:hypothetical protein
MGNTSQSGIFNEDEVKHLSRQDREKLRNHVSEQLHQAIGDLQKAKPELHQEIRDMVREKSKTVLGGMPKS